MKLALSWNAEKVKLYKYFKEVPEGKPIVVAVGAMAKGPDSFADDYIDQKIGKKLKKKNASIMLSCYCRYIRLCFISFSSLW